MARLDELWRAAGGPGAPPRLNSKRVKTRVNAALDADQEERKIYMKQKWRVALAAAAAAMALTGTAFAATANWGGLSDWFRGDTTPAQEFVQDVSQTVSDENYSLTVDSCASDGYSAYLTFTITALSDEAKEFIQDEHFHSIDTVELWIPSREEPGRLRPVGSGYRVLDAGSPDSLLFSVAIDDMPYAAEMLYVGCGYMEEGKRVKIPITPVEPLTMKIGASGSGVLSITSDPDENDLTITVDEITLSPFTCQVKYRGSYDIYPNLRLRMADGRVLTQSQTMSFISGHSEGSEITAPGGHISSFRFHEVQKLDEIASLIVFDQEYPLDGSKPTPVAHDPALDPVVVSRMDELEADAGYSIAVRELTEKLGGACAWDAASGTASCTYRGVTVRLRPGDSTALVDGKPVTMKRTPAVQNGALAADYEVFWDAWGIDGFVQRKSIRHEGTGEHEITWFDWYIIP